MSILVPILDEVDPSYTVIIRRLHSFIRGLSKVVQFFGRLIKHCTTDLKRIGRITSMKILAVFCPCYSRNYRLPNRPFQANHPFNLEIKVYIIGQVLHKHT